MRRSSRHESSYVAQLVQQADPQQIALDLSGVLGREAGPTFGEMADAWLHSIARVEPGNERRHLGHLRALRPLREGALNAARVQAELAGVKGLGPSTLNKLRSTGKLVIQHAQFSGQWTTPNPFALVRRAREVKRAYEVLTLLEVRRLLTTLEPAWRLLVKVAVLTGARPGELAALRKEDVDLDGRGVVHVHRSHERAATKTGKERVYPVPRCAEPDLRAALAEPGPLVFPSRYGRQRGRNCKLSRILNGALERAGISRHVRFYDLRHTSATLYREAGCDPLVIRVTLGHATRNLTDDLYTHLTADYMRRELAKLCLCGSCLTRADK